MKNTMELSIKALDYEGRGVARHQGKTVFVQNALPEEIVQATIDQSKSSFDLAHSERIIQPSAYRVLPRCAVYEQCGGCSLQHLESTAQVAMKQRIFAEQLERIGKVRPTIWLPAIYGSAWHYRHRTRLSVQVLRDGRLLLGFLGKRSHQVINIHQCCVLTKPLSGSLMLIQKTLNTLSGSLKKSIKAVELYHAQHHLALNIISQAHLPKTLFLQLSSQLANEKYTWQFWQQRAREMPICMTPTPPTLAYRLPEFQLEMPFLPGDFTQVNHALNEIMVRRAVQLLAPQSGEKIADLFCGLGNFSLPLAKMGAEVLGIDGEANLIARSQNNALFNGLNNARFQTQDLFTLTENDIKTLGAFDKVLLDPPRAGALAFVRALHAPFLPKKIVYVSCNPATFARDAAILVGKGYRFQCAGVMNLFAQTAHIEAIGVFDYVQAA